MSTTPPHSFSPEPQAADEHASTSAPAVAQPANAARVVCDLAECDAFTRGYSHPPAPILATFGAGRLHEWRISALCDLERALQDHESALVRSRRWVREKSPKGTTVPTQMIFAFGPRLFLHVDPTEVSGYAEDRAAAARLALDFVSKYEVPAKPAGGCFHLIRIQSDKIDTLAVHLEANTILSDETLALHYGDGFTARHRTYTRQLPERPCGLSIFEGAPGTGKTSYLRHLMGVLKESHRFYFVPPSHMSVLTRPDFVDFWVNEKRDHSDQRFIVILEDAEEAIMRRGSDNSAHVSAILNLSDGLLGDFVRLHVICTMNCAAADVDPALLRPGRLLSHQVFKRLDRSSAARLAKHLGKALPTASDYSLAEIFAGHTLEEASRPRIGFAA